MEAAFCIEAVEFQFGLTATVRAWTMSSSSRRASSPRAVLAFDQIRGSLPPRLQVRVRGGRSAIPHERLRGQPCQADIRHHRVKSSADHATGGRTSKVVGKAFQSGIVPGISRPAHRAGDELIARGAGSASKCIGLPWSEWYSSGSSSSCAGRP